MSRFDCINKDQNNNLTLAFLFATQSRDYWNVQ